MGLNEAKTDRQAMIAECDSWAATWAEVSGIDLSKIGAMIVHDKKGEKRAEIESAVRTYWLSHWRSERWKSLAVFASETPYPSDARKAIDEFELHANHEALAKDYLDEQMSERSQSSMSDPELEKILAKLMETTDKISFPSALVPAGATARVDLDSLCWPAIIRRIAFSKACAGAFKFTLQIGAHVLSFDTNGEAFTDPGAIVSGKDIIKIFPGMHACLIVTNKTGEPVNLEAWLAVDKLDVAPPPYRPMYEPQIGLGVMAYGSMESKAIDEARALGYLTDEHPDPLSREFGVSVTYHFLTDKGRDLVFKWRAEQRKVKVVT